MAKLFLFMMVSLDGYFEGKNHDLSWHNVDDEFNDFAARQMQEIGAIFLGHRTYDLMHTYWPTEKPSDKNDAIVAHQMNTLPKYVFSHTLEKVDEEENWKNVQVITSGIAQKVRDIKGKSQKNIAVLGSSNLCVSLLEEGLLDELRIMVSPIVIGQGTTLFAGMKEKVKFQLTHTRQFANGNVLLTYKVA